MHCCCATCTFVKRAAAVVVKCACFPAPVLVDACDSCRTVAPLHQPANTMAIQQAGLGGAQWGTCFLGGSSTMEGTICQGMWSRHSVPGLAFLHHALHVGCSVVCAGLRQLLQQVWCPCDTLFNLMRVQGLMLCVAHATVWCGCQCLVFLFDGVPPSCGVCYHMHRISVISPKLASVMAASAASDLRIAWIVDDVVSACGGARQTDLAGTAAIHR